MCKRKNNIKKNECCKNYIKHKLGLNLETNICYKLSNTNEYTNILMECNIPEDAIKEDERRVHILIIFLGLLIAYIFIAVSLNYYRKGRTRRQNYLLRNSTNTITNQSFIRNYHTIN